MLLQPTPEDVAQTLARLRADGRQATGALVADVRAEWSPLWRHTVRRAAADLLEGQDPLGVQRRLERLCEAYRDALSDVEHLTDRSLALQDLRLRRAVLRDGWAPTGAAPGDAGPARGAEPRWHPGWLRAVHPAASALLRDWPLRDEDRPPTDPLHPHWAAWHWRVPHNVYSGGHLPFHTLPAAEPCRDALERYALAGAGETLRRLAVVAGGGEDAPEEAELRARYGLWIDLETVAVSRCGWSDPHDDTTARIARARALDDALAHLRRVLAEHPQRDVIAGALRRWADHYGQSAHLSVRFPPAFAAAVAEALADTLLRHHPRIADRAPFDVTVLGATQADALPVPEQAFSHWLWLGELEPPSYATLTRGWDADDHAAAEQAGHRLTVDLRRHWAAKRRDDVPDTTVAPRPRQP